MFEFVGKHKRLVQLMLALITLPFAFFGVDYYFRQGTTSLDVATVGGDKISVQEFNRAIAEQQDRLRSQLGANYDPAIFDNPEVRYSLLEQLINRSLLQDKARQESFRVADSQLQQFIAAVPAFQDDGHFSPERYRMLLQGQNMSPLQFEDRVRQDLLLAPLQEPIANAGIVPNAIGERFVGLGEQKRDVQVAAIDSERFIPGIKVDDAQVKAFYDANAAALQTPEQAKIEYLILTPEALASQSQVTPEEVKAQYDRNVARYTKPEERDAAHILIAVKPDASASDRAAAKAKAEDLVAKAKASPAKFGDLAKQFSQDPGSAPQGGDLGSFGRGNMVKPFDDAVFAMKVGDVVGPVETDFGYHVIKLNGVSPAKVRPFDEVKGEIAADVQKQKATQKFATAADQFQNLVYEQADSLQGAAKALGLPVQSTSPLTRSQVQAIAKGNAKFTQALFSPDSTQAKRNTEAIEIAPNTLMAGRIVEYLPATQRPLADVQEEIRRQLIRKEASEMAQKLGREKLALLEQGKSAKDAGVDFSPAIALGRNDARPGYSPDALKRIFQLDPAKLPQYTGSNNEKGGFSIYRVTKVDEAPAPDAATLAAATTRMGSEINREMMSAYLAALKAKADVKINQANLDKK
jgi:peptidyl-prolyl cis-trans isomerase D